MGGSATTEKQKAATRKHNPMPKLISLIVIDALNQCVMRLNNGLLFTTFNHYFLPGPKQIQLSNPNLHFSHISRNTVILYSIDV